MFTDNPQNPACQICLALQHYILSLVYLEMAWAENFTASISKCLILDSENSTQDVWT